MRKTLFPVAALASACCLFPLGACAPGASDPQLSGTVTRRGEPVENSRVIAVNRITNEKHEVSTGVDGTYTLSLTDGYYDVGAEIEGHATIHGLVTLQGAPVIRDIALPEGDNADVVSGVVYVNGDTPAANYSVTLNGSVLDENDNPLDITVVTDENGQFAADVVGQGLFDADIYNEGGDLVEFIDLHKLEGALNLNLALGDEADNNTLRHFQSTASNIGCSGDESFSFSTESNSVDELGGSYVELTNTLSNGKLTVGGCLLSVVSADFAAASSTSGFESVADAPNTLDVQVRRDGRWWWPYAVHIRANQTLVAYFTDEFGDTYKLGVSNPSVYHQVSYSSDAPDIVKVVTEYTEE